VGDYFVNFGFSIGGRSAGAHASVHFFASGLIGHDQTGTSAGQWCVNRFFNHTLMKKSRLTAKKSARAR